MEQQEAMAALDRALVKLSEQAEKDDDMALAMEVVQAERTEAEYDGFHEGAEPKEPVRKEVAGAAGGAGALVVAFLAERAGVPMPFEVAAAFALVVGGFFAWLKSESFFVG